MSACTHVMRIRNYKLIETSAKLRFGSDFYALICPTTILTMIQGYMFALGFVEGHSGFLYMRVTRSS